MMDDVMDLLMESSMSLEETNDYMDFTISRLAMFPKGSISISFTARNKIDLIKTHLYHLRGLHNDLRVCVVFWTYHTEQSIYHDFPGTGSLVMGSA